MSDLQRRLDDATAEQERLRNENQRVRTAWGGQRTTASSFGGAQGDPLDLTPPNSAEGGGTAEIAPAILAMFDQQSKTLALMARMPQPTAPTPAIAPSIIQVMPAQSKVKRVSLSAGNITTL